MIVWFKIPWTEYSLNKLSNIFCRAIWPWTVLQETFKRDPPTIAMLCLLGTQLQGRGINPVRTCQVSIESARWVRFAGKRALQFTKSAWGRDGWPCQMPTADLPIAPCTRPQTAGMLSLWCRNRVTISSSAEVSQATCRLHDSAELMLPDRSHPCSSKYRQGECETGFQLTSECSWAVCFCMTFCLSHCSSANQKQWCQIALRACVFDVFHYMNKTLSCLACPGGFRRWKYQLVCLEEYPKATSDLLMADVSWEKPNLKQCP